MKIFIISLLLISAYSCGVMPNNADRMQYKRMPKLSYSNSRLKIIVDSVINVEKTKDYYHRNLRFYINCSNGDYISGGNVIQISAGTTSVFDESNAGAFEQQGHIVVIQNKNDFLFNELFTKNRNRMKVDFYSRPAYIDKKSGMTTLIVLNDDRYDLWEFLYEDCEIAFVGVIDF